MGKNLEDCIDALRTSLLTIDDVTQVSLTPVHPDIHFQVAGAADPACYLDIDGESPNFEGGDLKKITPVRTSANLRLLLYTATKTDHLQLDMVRLVQAAKDKIKALTADRTSGFTIFIGSVEYDHAENWRWAAAALPLTIGGYDWATP